jgi:cobalt-zinc-cadmium efflux system membrane fusion protein
MLGSTARLAAAGWFLVSWLAAGGDVFAHEGHDHGAPPPPVTATIAPRADTSSADFEAVLIARSDALVVYLDTFRGNAPVENATIEIDTPDGVLQAKPDDRGAYVVAADFLKRPGRYELALTVTAGDLIDVLPATLIIPDGAPPATASTGSLLVPSAFAEGLRQRIGGTDLSLVIAAVGGFLVGAFAVAVLRKRSPSVAVVGLVVITAATWTDGALADTAPPVAARDVAQRFADGALFVPKPTQRILGIRTTFTAEEAHRRAIELPGRIVPDPNASGLVQSSVGGRLSPPAGGFKPLGTSVRAGDVLAYVRPPVPSADVTAQQQQARELDQQISLVTRKIERLKAVEQVIARGQLEDAELELKGLRERRTNLERVTREAEPLVAPVDGIIAASNAVAGQMAEPNSVIYQIIDARRLWVEALSFDPRALAGPAQGLFAGGRTLTLAYLGTGLADRNQAVPVHFAVDGDTSGLRPGQFLTVLAQSSEERRGLALPREAVLRGANGQSIVYEHTNAERFVVREVRVEPLDGERVLVVAGVEAGRRVVTQGAELLNQIR